MRLTAILIFCFYFFPAGAQIEDFYSEYPKEFRKVDQFVLSSPSDTFDSFERVLILTTDSNLRSVNTDSKSYRVFKDSGRFALLSPNMLLLQATTIHDTMDILTFRGQILLIPQNCKQPFINQYYKTKASYKKSKKKDRKHSFGYILLGNLYFDKLSYHRRNEYTKWLKKQFKKKDD